MRLDQRRVLGKTMSLGPLTLLTGCDITDNDAVQRVLAGFSAWNDRVQRRWSAAHDWRRPSPTILR